MSSWFGREESMFDVLMLGVGFGSFVVLILYLGLCEKL
jgi:hypothetical protein